MLVIDEVEYDEEALPEHAKYMLARLNELTTQGVEQELMLQEINALIPIYQNSIKEAVEAAK